MCNTATPEQIEELMTRIEVTLKELYDYEKLWLELMDNGIEKHIDVLVNCALSSLKDISGTRCQLEFLKDLIQERV